MTSKWIPSWGGISRTLASKTLLKEVCCQGQPGRLRSSPFSASPGIKMLFWYNLLEQRMMLSPPRELVQHHSSTLHCVAALCDRQHNATSAALLCSNMGARRTGRKTFSGGAQTSTVTPALARGTCGIAASLTRQIQPLKFNPRSAGLIKGLLLLICKEDLSLEGGSEVLSTAVIWQINCKGEINQLGILSWKSSDGCISCNLTINTRHTTQLCYTV